MKQSVWSTGKGTILFMTMSLGSLAWGQAPIWDKDGLCPMKNPEMKLMHDCNQGGLHQYSSPNVRYFGSADSDDNKPNYCYHSLMFVNPSTKSTKVQFEVVRDYDGELGVSYYTTPRSNTEEVLKFPDTEGSCFVYEESNSSNCQNWYFRTLRADMYIKLKKIKEDTYTPSIINPALNPVALYVEKSLPNEKMDKNKISRIILQEIRARLIAYAKRMPTDDVVVTAEYQALHQAALNCLDGLSRLDTQLPENMHVVNTEDIPLLRQIRAKTLTGKGTNKDQPNNKEPEISR